MNNHFETLFTPHKIGQQTLKNRLSVAPMTRVSAHEDGTAGPLMKDYYQSFAKGGFAMIITEGIYTDKQYSQGYKFQPGLVDETHVASWKPIIDAVHECETVMIAQLMHAGALCQYNKYTGHGAGPSSVKPLGQQMSFYYGQGDYSIPKEMSATDINDVINGFVQAAKLAQGAGFDGVEIHGANGYLLDQFLTVYSNHRDDEYGGVLTNRLKIYQDIIGAVREAVGADFIIGVRVSQTKVNDGDYKWPGKEADAKQIFSTLMSLGVDYIHTTEGQAKAPAFEGSLSLGKLAKAFTNVPVIANGGVEEAEHATFLIESDQADVISLGKAALANPNWPNAVRANQSLQAFDFELFNPIADLATANTYLDKKRQSPDQSTSLTGEHEIIVYTDYVCPFCLLAEKSLRAAIAGKKIKITWRPFELRPFPVATLKVEDDYLPSIWQRAVYPMAERLGINIQLPSISPQPRTDKAFEAFAYAQQAGLGDAFSMATLSAFFQNNQDISDTDVLLSIAHEVGLDREALQTALDEKHFTQAHQDALRRARDVEKITVVPTIIIGNERYEGVASDAWLESAIGKLKA